MSWVWANSIHAGQAHLADFELPHLTKALRKRPGATLQLIDGVGTRAAGTWQSGTEVALTHTETLSEPTLTLALCLGSRDSNEQSIRRAAEFGVRAVQPVYSDRSSDARAPATINHKRWLTILRSGCAQSGNPWLPELLPAVDWSVFRRDVVPDRTVVFCPTATTRAWHPGETDCVVVGPEGGFGPEETAGLTCVSLGPFALRTPVAVAAVLSAAALERPCAA